MCELHVWAPHALLAHFADALADTIVRRASATAHPLPEREARETAGPGPWEERFVSALSGPDPTFRLDGFLARTLPDGLRAWAAPGRGAETASAPRLCLKLDPPDDASGAWTIAYFLQDPNDPSLLVPARRVWGAAGERFRWMDRTFEAPQEHLLTGLAFAARVFLPIEESLKAMRPAPASLTVDDAWRFVSETAPLLMESGTKVLLPAEMTTEGRRRLRLRMRVGRTRPAPGAVTAAGLAMDSLVEFQWEVALGDRALSRAEFREMVALKRPLVRWRGQWLVLDPREIAEIAHLFAQTRTGTLPAPQALAAALAGGLPRADGRIAAEVVADGPLASLIGHLRAGVEPAPPPADLEGTLRPYQTRGLGWLSVMADLGLGGCLADDMGLGKTIQLMAFLLARRSARPEDPRPSLIVCPTSVLGNWERELSRFASTLPVVRHHGAARSKEALHELAPHAVALTTYSLLRRDAALLGGMEWAVAALDEAQNVKNAASLQAQAARARPVVYAGPHLSRRRARTDRRHARGDRSGRVRGPGRGESPGALRPDAAPVVAEPRSALQTGRRGRRRRSLPNLAALPRRRRAGVRCRTHRGSRVAPGQARRIAPGQAPGVESGQLSLASSASSAA